MRASLLSWLRRWIGPVTVRRVKRKRRNPIAQELETRMMMHCTLIGDSVTVVEADAGTSAVVTVSLSEPQEQDLFVGYMTKAVSATKNIDYEHVEGTLTFAAGVTSLQVTLPILGDALSEGEETFHLDLNCEEAHGSHAHLVIRDNDPLPSVSISDATPVEEGRTATEAAVFTVALSQVAGRPITVSYRTVSGTATEGEDFTQARGALVFGAGETLKQVTVSIKGDVRQEAEETFALEITAADYATIVDGTASGTILAEDIQLLVTGAGPGDEPSIGVWDPLTGQQRMFFSAFEPAFRGGVRVATADVNRDGVTDIVAAAGPGGGPHVRVFDGLTGQRLPGAIGDFFAYDQEFTGGVNIAAADINGDGFADIITGADEGGGPHVRAFSGKDGSRIADFLAYANNFTGGVHVAAADLDGDRRAEIITGPGRGLGPQVRVFHANGQQIEGPLGSFMAYDPEFTGGVYVAAGDVNGDRHVDIVTGAGRGGGPQVRVFDGRTKARMKGELGSFWAYEPEFRGGVTVATGFADGDNRVDIVTGAAFGGGPHVRTFNSRHGGRMSNVWPYDPNFTGGVSVAAHGWIEPVPEGLTDPLEVFDANDGLLLREGVTEHEVAGFAVDLRAQVYGGMVDTYEWDLTGASGAINVTGDDTYRLQFEWDEETTGVQTIVLTTVNLDTTVQTRTLSFIVEPPEDQEQTTFADEWESVLTPDQQRAGQELVREQYYELSVNSGELYVPHRLPGYNPRMPALELVYSSQAANPRPVFVVRHELAPGELAPDLVSATLTFNSIEGDTVFYDTALLNGGNLIQISLQADATGVATGRYSYSIEIVEEHTTPIPTTYSGEVNIINSDDSVFGDGWSLAGLHRLHSVTGGLILELERGLSLWFEEDGGDYISPPGDFSSLVENLDGSFTRTLKDGTECNFTSAGLMTSWVDRNGNTISYAYDSGKLTTITDSNSLDTDFDYAGDHVTTITDPADRETTLGFTGDLLTSIVDADAAVWGYEYDAEQRMELLVNPREFEWAFVYNDAGRVDQVNRPDDTEQMLVAAQFLGLATGSQGTEMNPAPAQVLVEAMADYTDPRGEHWTTRLDSSGFGYAVEQVDPLDYVTVAHRDPAGLPFFVRDAEDFRTRFFRDEQGNVVRRIDADNFEELFEYNGFSQVTAWTDARGFLWESIYDADGNLTDSIWPVIPREMIAAV